MCSFQGFEARGTLINKRWRTRLFLSHAVQRDMFSPVPPVTSLTNTKVMYDVMQNCPNLNFTTIKTRIRKRAEPNWSGEKKNTRKTQGSNDYTKNAKRDAINARISRMKRDKPSALRMCDSPNVYMKSRINYKTIYKAVDNQNMMTTQRIKAVCRMENKVMRSLSGFEKRCFKRNITISNDIKEICCPSWSLGNYIAALSWKPSCEDINDRDVTKMTKRLQMCSGFFHNKTLKENCWDYNNAAPFPYCA
ncbi:Protein dispatched-like 1, partial [Exaiptasia diaphana]